MLSCCLWFALLSFFDFHLLFSSPINQRPMIEMVDDDASLLSVTMGKPN